MRRIVIGDIGVAGYHSAESTSPAFADYTVVEWLPPHEYTSTWEIVERRPDPFPTYHGRDWVRTLFTITPTKWAPVLHETIVERRWHVREWSDETSGARMLDRTEETRTFRV